MRTEEGWSEEERDGARKRGRERSKGGARDGESEQGSKGAREGGKCHGRYPDEDTGQYTVYSAQNNPQRGPCA